MLDNRENQSLLITGESGAGKTENTKKVIQYLAAVAADMAAGQVSSSSTSGPPQRPDALTRSNSSILNSLSKAGSARYVMDRAQGNEAVGGKQLGLLERQILQANPILEAFGNAQTIRNNNSSRFGKFVRIEFTATGTIAGANIDWYLLEKSRVHNRSDKERSFHVFYQLLRSGERELMSKLLLTGNPSDYSYLKSTRQNVEGLDDGADWKDLRAALDIVGFSSDEQFNIFQVVASILQIGNIELADDRSGAEQARINNVAHLEKVCHLLGVPQQELMTALLRPRVKAGREWVEQSRTRKQVVEEMAALCKMLYEKTFGSIVERINQALDRPTSKSTFIGVLDIAGFEIFEMNSFEQLCINYTNERLQQFFNHHMFVLEQEEYAREDIEWDFVNFGLDLQPTIDLIESTSPVGILSCLDEECIMPKASDETFTEKCNRTWASKRDGSAKDEAAAAAAADRGVAHGSTKYIPARFATGFTIKHYAGNVEYRTDGWLDKNKDPLNDNLTRVMASSSDRFIASLFSEFAPEDDYSAAASGSALTASPAKRRAKRGAFRTLAQRHKEQLNSLMNQLASTQPHFVRCIVPNAERKPGKMDVPMVLDQLRCNGVLEGIRIARLGYPNRLLFNEFRTRYEVLTPDIIPKGYMDGRKACQRMVEAMQLDTEVFKIGLTKIFFKAGILADLEERRDALLYDIFARFQAGCRMFTARRQMKKILNRASAVRTIQRNARLYAELRDWPWWALYSQVRPMLKATKHDEELRRKEQELALATERAERDQKERAALEALKLSLESEKKMVEDELASERSLLAEKDALLARSKQREAALEEDLAAMQGDIDQLDSQIERALAAQKTAEAARQELQIAFDQAVEHLIRLEAAEKDWKSREATLTGQIAHHSSRYETSAAEQQALLAAKSDLESRVKESVAEKERHQKRLGARIAELETALATEKQSGHQGAAQITQLEDKVRKTEAQVAELKSASTSKEALLKDRDNELTSTKSQLTKLGSALDALRKEHSQLDVKHVTASTELSTTRTHLQQASDARAQVQCELDETRKLMADRSSEDVKQREMRQRLEEELSNLRSESAKLQKDLTSTKTQSAEQIIALKAQVDSAQQQHRKAADAHQEASTKLSDHVKKLAEVTAALSTAEAARSSLKTEHKAIQDRLGASESSLSDHRAKISKFEQQLAESQEQFQQTEDALLEMERLQTESRALADKTASELVAERKRREGAEQEVAQRTQLLSSLQQQTSAQEKDLSNLRNELMLTQADLRKAQSMTNKTIVEHVHVLEEAKRYTDKQLAQAQEKIREMTLQLSKMDKTNVTLKRDNEDLNREVGRIQRGEAPTPRAYTNLSTPSANGSPATVTPPALDKFAARNYETKINDLNSALKDARRERDEALSSARRKQLAEESARDQYEARILALERQLQGSQLAHSNTYQNLQDLVRENNSSSPGPSGSGLRSKLLEELQLGHDALEADIAAKSDLLRFHQKNQTANGQSPLARSTRIGEDGRPSWAASPQASDGTHRGTTVMTPSAMKRQSLSSSSSSSNGEAQRLIDNRWKEVQIDLASSNQNALESRRKADQYKSRAEESENEVERLRAYIEKLERGANSGDEKENGRYERGGSVERQLRESQLRYDRRAA